MENKINLRRNLSYAAAVLIGIFAVAFMISELIINIAAKNRKAELANTALPKMEPKQILKNVYQDANKYFASNSTGNINNLDGYCSKSLKQIFNQNKGLMVYTFARETRNGKLKGVDIVSQTYRGLDSAIVDARATYTDGTSKPFQQMFIMENGFWKLALKYGHDIK